MDSYGKLVRDRIPEIIRAEGTKPITYVAGSQEYRSRLRDKLGEEVAEFLSADEAVALGELADVLEVVHALAADLGTDSAGLESVRQAKARERGVFADRIIWKGNC
ncbi:nucleoside triphosphate pyrophosphohydrolase [Streptomyces sp. NPDC055243]|uniref:nucleoside triphosphate pyrophosphohydrolase n=1 Tax=Streptomyces sp. NPDC055243 TaxID=3365720 RepID=UPI0037D086A2